MSFTSFILSNLSKWKIESSGGNASFYFLNQVIFLHQTVHLPLFHENDIRDKFKIYYSKHTSPKREISLHQFDDEIDKTKQDRSVRRGGREAAAATVSPAVINNNS